MYISPPLDDFWTQVDPGRSMDKLCGARRQAAREGVRDRTEPAEPNRSESINSGTGRNRTRNRTEPNRTGPDRATTLTKNTGQPEQLIAEPNQTEPIRIEPNRFLPDNSLTYNIEDVASQ